MGSRMKMNHSTKFTSVIVSIILCILSKADCELILNRTFRKLVRPPERRNLARDCRIHYTKLPFRGNYQPNFNIVQNNLPVLEMVGNSNLRMVYAYRNGGRRLILQNLEEPDATTTYIKVLGYPCYGDSVVEGDYSAVSRRIRVLPLYNGEQSGLLFRIKDYFDTECTLFSNDPASWGVFKIDWALPLENDHPQLRNGAAVFVYSDSGSEIRHETSTQREHVYSYSSPCSHQYYRTIGEIKDEHFEKTGRHLYRVNPSFDQNCVISGINSWNRVGIDGLYYIKGRVVNGFQVLRNDLENTELHVKEDESGFILLRMCDKNDDTCDGPQEIRWTSENPCSVYPREEASVYNSESVEIGTLRNVYPFTSCHFYAVTDLFRGHFHLCGGNDIYGEPNMCVKDSHGHHYEMSHSGSLHADDLYLILKNGITTVGHFNASTHPCMASFGETSTETFLLQYPITFAAAFSNRSGQFIRIDKRFPGCLLYADANGFKGYVDYGITDDGLPLLTNGFPTMMIKRLKRENAVRSNAQSLLYFAESDDTDFPRGFRLQNMQTMEIRFLQSHDPYYHLCLDKFGSSLELVDFNFQITGRVFKLDSRRKEDYTMPNVCGLIDCGDYSTCSYHRGSGSQCDCNANTYENSFKTEPEDKLSPCESSNFCDPSLENQCGFGVCQYIPCGESSCRHNLSGSHCVCSAGYVQRDPSDPRSRCDIMDHGHQCITQACHHGDCVPGDDGDWGCSCWPGANHRDLTDPKSVCSVVKDICSTLDCVSTTCTYSHIDGGSKCACDENDNLTWEYIGRTSKCVRKLP